MQNGFHDQNYLWFKKQANLRIIMDSIAKIIKSHLAAHSNEVLSPDKINKITAQIKETIDIFLKDGFKKVEAPRKHQLLFLQK